MEANLACRYLRVKCKDVHIKNTSNELQIKKISKENKDLDKQYK